jgi:poly(hydroxyalkanoate) depolymerase family esterase
MSKQRFTEALGAMVALGLLGCGGVSSPEESPSALGEVTGALTQVASFGSNPGNLKMWKHVPANMPANAPLVVAMHGCTQTASAYTQVGWNTLAEQLKFYVVYPEQSSSNNQTNCFNWFEPSDTARGQGEALSIKQMVDKMAADHSIDGRRVFVTGLSAGAAMTQVMAATYPDVFAGGAVMAGLPYKCATSMTSGFSCMSPGSDKTPAQWASLVRGAYSGYSGSYPKMSLWHGTSDYTVKNSNQTESMEQWTAVHGIDQTPDVSDTVEGYPHKVYKNSAGTALVETYDLTGMGHGTAIDPAVKFPGTTAACGTAGAYVLDTNICSTWYVARFFGLDTSNADTTAPTVSLTAPSPGASVSGQVRLTANAADNVGVTQVQFLVDGTPVGTDTTTPYEATWNSAAASSGTHTLVARAFDAAGNSTASSAITVTVTGGVSDTVAPTVALTAPSAGATLSGSVNLTATASDNVGVSRVDFLVDGTAVGQGTPSGGTYTLAWNSATVSAGTHAVSARAFDAAGNSALSSAVSVTVSAAAERFSETFSQNGPDNTGWNLGEWTLDSSDQTGTASSKSLAASATPAFNTVTRTASVTVKLTSSPRLTYWRKLDLSGANTSASVSFQVIVNDGTDTVVDSVTKGLGTVTESAWTQRANLDLSAYANKTVTLKFIVTAKDLSSTVSRAKAWVDGIRVGP